MIETSQIQDYVQKVAQEFRPERVILFGSYADGNPDDASDVDLLVVMNHRRRKNLLQAVAIDQRIPRTFALDLIVRKPAEIKQRVKMNDFFLKNITERGKVLYERRRQRVD